MGSLSNSVWPIIGIATFALGIYPAIAWWLVWESRRDKDDEDEDYRRFVRRIAAALSVLCGGLYILFFFTFPFG